MEQATHNARLRQLIREVSSAAAPESDRETLLAAVQLIRDFNGPLRFDNRTPLFIGVFATLLFIAVIAFAQWGSPEAKHWLTSFATMKYDGVLLLAGVFALVTLTASFGFMWHRRNLLPTTSEDIARQSSRLTAGLISHTTPRQRLLLDLSSHFGDYARGNYSRELTQALQAVYPGALHELYYSYFQLHYVNKRIVTTTESDGKGGRRTVTRTVYDHYDRYSLVVEFPWVEGITARTGNGSGLDFEHHYQTASTDFNKAFALSGSSTMACAKFAKPVTVLHLLAMHRQLKGMNLEFSFDGRLCISFENSNMLDFDMPCDLYDAEQFYRYIETGARLPHLEKVLELVHTLAEQHDDNFNLPTASVQYEEH